MPSGAHKTRVLLTGGTGQVGILALPRLLAAGYPVIACSRRISGELGKAPSRDADNLRWIHPASVLSANSRSGAGKPGAITQDVTVLLSCGPVELAAQLTPLCPQLRRVICISSSSVYTKMASADSAERRLIAGIKASEDELRQNCLARDISLVLLRPTMIYGCGLDQNVSRIAFLAKRFRFMPVAGRASGRRQPVHADDLAQLVLSMIEAKDLPALECPVGGGSVLSYREMVERIFTGLGLRPHILQLPPQILAALTRMAAWLPFSGGLNTQFVFRQNIDLLFDDSQVRARFGFRPRPFAPTAADFKVPEHALAAQPR